MRWIRRVVVALIVIIVIAFALGWRLLAGSRPQADGNVAVQGLSAAVTIARDADGIPVITAGNRGDLAWALGFVHGQERFFQMDLQRRVAAGEPPALVGAPRPPVGASPPQHPPPALGGREPAP